MAATLQKQRVIPSQKEKQDVDTWSTVFNSGQKTIQQSLTFVKKLVNVGISSITYLRAVLPESAYCDESAEGLALKLLNVNSNCRRSAIMIGWINGCFDALENKYLRQLNLEFSRDAKNPDSAFETYSFNFKYTDDGMVEMEDMSGMTVSECKKVKNKFEVRRPTIKMIRTIILLTNSLQPLPEKSFMSLKLKYYDEITPEDYQPPGFKECDDEGTPPNDSIKIKIGQVTTPFHTILLKCCTERQLFMTDGDESISRMECNNSEESDIANIPIKAPTLHSGLVSTTQESRSNSQLCNDGSVAPSKIKPVVNIPEQTPLTQYMSGYNTPKFENSSLRTPMSEKLSSNVRTPCSMENKSTPEMICPSQPDPDYPVRCPCQVNLDEGLMILCDICGSWQHAVCFLVINENQAPDSHICERCGDNSNICTDPKLLYMTEEQLISNCLYRRMLVLFEKSLEGKKVSSCTLAQSLGIDITKAVNLFKAATDDSILVYLNEKEGISNIDRQKLLNWAFPKYLNYDLQGTKESPRVNQHVNGNSTDSDATPDLPFLSFRQADFKETQDVPVATSTGKTGLTRVTDNDEILVPNSNIDMLSENSKYMFSQSPNGQNYDKENLIPDCGQSSNDATVGENTATQDLLETQLFPEQGNSEPFFVGNSEVTVISPPVSVSLSRINLSKKYPESSNRKSLDKPVGTRLSRSRKRLGDDFESQVLNKEVPDWEISDSQGSSQSKRIQRRVKASRTSSRL